MRKLKNSTCRDTKRSFLSGAALATGMSSVFRFNARRVNSYANVVSFLKCTVVRERRLPFTNVLSDKFFWNFVRSRDTKLNLLKKRKED